MVTSHAVPRMKQTLQILAAAALMGSACTVEGPPAFPDNTSAMLAGPLCDIPDQPCRCATDPSQAGQPAQGYRRFEIQLGNTRGTSSAVTVEGIGTFLRDESNPEGSCFYFDTRLGSTHHVRYLAQSSNRDRGISVAFNMREVADEQGWYSVLEQRCGSSSQSCRYESVEDWTRAISSGHRFHDRCGSTDLIDMRVDGGLYDRHFIDAQLTFDMLTRDEGPRGEPGGACRAEIVPPTVSPEQE